MTPGRASKWLARRLTIAWREQPTQTEIEELQANVARVGLVVRMRWAIVVALVVFSAAGALIYMADGQFTGMWRHMAVPAVALLFVLVYNAFYQVNYRRLGNVAGFNQAALLLDIAVVTVLIYYSGGIYSWFDSMYLLFVLEAALILPRRGQVWLIAFAAIAAYLLVPLLVYTRVLPHVALPFVENQLQYRAAYVAVRALWSFTIIAGTATIGTLLMDDVRSRVDRLAAQSVRDEMTGLYNRSYLRAELGLEIERARRYKRGVCVMIVDVDNLDGFNRTFGHDAGNDMLVAVAGALRSATSGSGDGDPLVVTARYGGEEFAVLVPETGATDCTAGTLMAERVREAVAAARVDDRSVTVSIGLASYPLHGRTPQELMASADSALAAAAAAGGNRVVTAGAGRDGANG